jgi:tyrosine-protein kinase Etk/Wzc
MLDVISAGTTPPNPAELLGSVQMAELLVSLREKYDHIILDAPPVLAVSDAPILVRLCDTMVILIEAGRVPQKAIMRVREVLSTVEAPVAGFVINDKSRRIAAYGYGGYGYGGYGYGEEGLYSGVTKKPWYEKLLAKLKR